jgi:glycine hydroxymethyltransferase
MERDYKIISGGTDNHMILIDLRNKNISGKQAEEALGVAGITVNKNMVPFDDKSPFVTSGIRIGTPAITTRGLQENEMEKIVNLIDDVIKNFENTSHLESIREQVHSMMSQKPLFAETVKS